MQSKKADVPDDGRLGSGDRPLKKVELIWQRICEKQREIRLLEIELARTDPDELVKKIDQTVEVQRAP